MNNYQYQKFSNRITRWIKKEQLNSCIEPLNQYHELYLIKSNRRKVNTKYAVFVMANNKLRREQDIKFVKKMSFADLAIINLERKREGISLLKTLTTIML